ncbi:nitrate- and nitrite sensing domain-containing protein [Kineosporia sp. NBRC 101731]|uniref:sensor histidine kinase n=1 Tax=Kineosporia sp. NBRC 101731 TaxID=3032199 RepID=UPI0024A41826|nr:nitrate- and nitrite sensing domain-containing protein [Kineosporia sp. NBRC 101731]GLY30607.1 histidine kinase [Kineosporia sp. NBRC 101731]
MAPKARGPRTRMGGRSIRTRILLLGWVPSLSLLVVGVILAGYLALSARDIRDGNSVMETQLGSSRAFIPEAEREGRLSVVYLADPKASRTELDAQRARTDQVLATLNEDAVLLQENSPDYLAPVFADLGALGGGMAQMRKSVDDRTLPAADAQQYWSNFVDLTYRSISLMARTTPNGESGQQEREASELIHLVNQMSQGNALAYLALSNEGLTPEEYQTFVKTGGVYRDRLEFLSQMITDPGVLAKITALTESDSWRQQARIEQAVLSADALTVRERQKLLAGTPVAEVTGATNTLLSSEPTPAQIRNGNVKADLPIPSSAWETAHNDVTDQLVDIAISQLAYSSGMAVDLAETRYTQSIAGGIGLVIFAAIVLSLTARESNRLTRRLRGLRDQTLDLADNRLPALVEGLRTGEVDDETRQMPKLHYGRDEIGEVASAFNHAQEVAVNAAVQEAETRNGLREVFLNIAYRSQVIVHRQLGVLEKAERFEEDPEQIELLFELDHLATRARRNAENLVILGGGQPGRRWRNSVELLQVVRSSISEAQDYARVSVGRLPRLSINGGAVADVIHLLAELVDNATSFSPPMSKVEVRGNLVGKGLVLEIEDQGLGIPADKLTELNEMLTTAPDFHALTLREEPRLGMFVVAQLAAGQNIRVTLTPSPAYGGTKAVVLIPSDLFDASGGGVTGSTGTLALDGADDSAVAPGARSLHERMAITGEMTGEITVVPGDGTPERPFRSSAPALSVAPDGPRNPTGPLQRIGRGPEQGGQNSQDGQNGLRGQNGLGAPGGQIRPMPSASRSPEPMRSSSPGYPPSSRIDQSGGGSEPMVNPQARADYLASRSAGPATGSLPVRSSGMSQSQMPAPMSSPAGLAKGAPTPPAGVRGSSPGTSVTRGATRTGRPELPRRVRQANLSDRLKSSPVPSTGAMPQDSETTGPLDPEAARNRMAAFQRGTQRGRTERPDGA